MLINVKQRLWFILGGCSLMRLAVAVVQNIPSLEINTLHILYNSTNGTDWAWRGSDAVWNFTAGANPCTDKWQGVTCNLVAPTQPRYIVELNLERYNLHGPLLASIANLTKLNTLGLQSNDLSGPIPATIGDLSDLTLLSLGGNNFTSTIPSSFNKLKNLQHLELFTNSLTGIFPYFVTGLTALTSLALYRNDLSGTIPANIAYLVNLQDLSINTNRFNGSIPDSLGQIPGLTNLLLYGNKMTGTIPASLCNPPHMRQFVLRTNRYVGSIPACVSNWSNMTYFDVSDNHLTGPLPAGLSNANHLELLWAHNNSLSGTIPSAWGRLHKLRELYLHQNRLTGTIPPELQGLNILAYLYLQQNHLTGSIPRALSLPTLTLFYVNDNQLTGTIPQLFAKAPDIQEVFLQNNQLSGNLAGLFNRTFHRSLQIVQVSGNHISGSLPAEIFRLPQLNTFAASTNCFSGTLSDAFCHSERLTTLILDGLRSASACRSLLLPATQTYTESGNGHGTVPSCLFHMVTLSTLHLAANGLTGTLPDDAPPSLRLSDLSLSHNALTGTIPTSYQNRYWSSLDLSFNRLTGNLQSSLQPFAPDATTYGRNISVNSTSVTFALQNNRLSGNVPGAMTHFPNVSMLGSNLFTCAVDKSNLPHHDNDFATYQCASNAFDYSFYTFLGALVLLLALLVCLTCLPRVIAKLPLGAIAVESALKWRIAESTVVTLRHFRYVLTVSDILCQIGVLCTVLIVVVLVPWYSAASHYYGTYTHQYAYVVSAAFLSGTTPAVVNLTCYILLIGVIAGSCLYFVVRRDSKLHRSSGHLHVRTSANSAFKIDPNMARAPRRAAIYAAFLSVNLIAVVGINVAFVAIALTQNNAVLFVAQILLSLFKLLWNTVCAPHLVRLAASMISSSYHSAGFVSVQVFVALLNNVAIPCLVVAVVSPSCFVNVFVPAPTVHSSFVYYPTVRPGPTAVIQLDLFTATDYISYQPPFTYNYQCSSSFITYYAPAFVYLAIAAGIIAPVAKVVGLWMYQRCAPQSYTHYFLHATLPSILTVSMEDTTVAPSERSYFDANIYIITLMTYLGILLTFGVVFPPLAVAMCVTMLSVAWQGRVAVGRYLHNARTLHAQSFIDAIDQGCKGAVSMEKLRLSLLTVIHFAAYFYALFVFDTLGNAVGVNRAYWVLIVLPLLPLLITVLTKLEKTWEVAGAGQHAVGYSLDDTVFELQMRGHSTDSAKFSEHSTVVNALTEGVA